MEYMVSVEGTKLQVADLDMAMSVLEDLGCLICASGDSDREPCCYFEPCDDSDIAAGKVNSTLEWSFFTNLSRRSDGAIILRHMNGSGRCMLREDDLRAPGSLFCAECRDALRDAIAESKSENRARPNRSHRYNPMAGERSRMAELLAPRGENAPAYDSSVLDATYQRDALELADMIGETEYWDAEATYAALQGVPGHFTPAEE